MSAHAGQRGPGLWDEVCSPKMQRWTLLALADLFVINRPHTPIPGTVRRAGCGRSEEGQYGRTVEAIEQPIAAPASSPVGEPAHTRFVRDVRSRTYGNPSSSCSPGLSTQGLGSSRTRRRLRRHGARSSLCARVHGCVHVGAPSRRACAPACMLQCSLLRAAGQQHEWCRGDRA